MAKKDVEYLLDDSFEISEKVRNMSDEEMDRQIAILEAKGREERKKIKKRKTLLMFDQNE